mgnify:CR=1 FL=1
MHMAGEVATVGISAHDPSGCDDPLDVDVGRFHDTSTVPAPAPSLASASAIAARGTAVARSPNEMTPTWHFGRPDIPVYSIVLCVAALAVPVTAQVAFAESAGQHELLLWLLAVVPAFLLAYYRAWRGVATALAAGMADAALGTDSGGSVRIPSSWCGITGLKTTIGRVSTYGVLPLSSGTRLRPW